MDAIDVFGILFISILVIFLGYTLGVIVLKMTNPKKHFIWIYHGIPHMMSVPDLTKSQYYDLFPDKSMNWLGCYPTIDDVVLKDIADNISAKCRNKSDSYKYGFVLAFVQQNIKYVSDIKHYGDEEIWCLPIQTLKERTGDCEDTAILYCSIIHLMDLDTCLAIVPGHAVSGAKNGLGASFECSGRKYYFAETTSVIPIPGFYTASKNVRYCATPILPVKEFLDSLHKR